MFSRSIVAALKAHLIRLIKFANVQILPVVEGQDLRGALNHQEKSRRTASEKVLGQALLIAPGKSMARIRSELRPVRWIEKEEVFGLGAIALKKCLEVFIFNDSIIQALVYSAN